MKMLHFEIHINVSEKSEKKSFAKCDRVDGHFTRKTLPDNTGGFSQNIENIRSNTEHSHTK